MAYHGSTLTQARRFDDARTASSTAWAASPSRNEGDRAPDAPDAFAGVGAKRGIPENAGGGAHVTDLRFGQEAPGFSLPSSAGGQTSLSDFKGKSDVVLVFYCYDWGSI